MRKPLTLKAFVIAGLRRMSYRWPYRNEALKLARIARNTYRCLACDNLFGRREVQVDHIAPVVAADAASWDWNSYVERMFPGATGYQVLCKPCHKLKTAAERSLRKATREKTGA